MVLETYPGSLTKTASRQPWERTKRLIALDKNSAYAQMQSSDDPKLTCCQQRVQRPKCFGDRDSQPQEFSICQVQIEIKLTCSRMVRANMTPKLETISLNQIQHMLSRTVSGFWKFCPHIWFVPGSISTMQLCQNSAYAGFELREH